MKTDKKRIALAGPAGSGKSTVAELVSNDKNIPFLRAKDITTPILKRDGYDYASGLQVEKFLQTRERQLEILKKTQEQIKTDAFITDRCMVDLAAYALSGIDYLDAETLEEILRISKSQTSTYTDIFLFKTGSLIDNKKRTMNRHFQDLIYTIELGLLTEWGVNFTIIDHPVIDAKFKADIVFQKAFNDVLRN